METKPMSKAVDKFIVDLENNYGATPKLGNVSPQAKTKKDGKYGVAYTATPKKADPVIVELPDGTSESSLATAIEEMNAVLPDGEPTYEEEYAAAHGKENEMQVSKPVKMKVPKGCFDVSKMLTAPTVTMLEAKKLYQPVRGTSSGSRYFMIAIGPALRVSARWKTSPTAEGLALRVEGAGLSNPDTVKLLVQIGLDLKSPTHMSAHLTVANVVEARKAIGALLMAINEPWSTPMPDPEVVCL